MRVKLDENLPISLAVVLAGHGHDVHTAYEEGLSGSTDTRMWEAALRERRFFVTQDLDFSDTRRFAPGTHSGILLIRLRTPSRTSLISRIREVFQAESVSEWTGCFVVVTERKVRVRRPVVQ